MLDKMNSAPPQTAVLSLPLQNGGRQPFRNKMKSTSLKENMLLT